MIKVGITERGDPAFNKEVFARLLPANIIITKNVMAIEEELLANREKIVLHATITGMGKSSMEPFVPDPKSSIHALMGLIEQGFPAEQIVLRVDPILPDPAWFECAESVIRQAPALTAMGVRRMRYSIIDLYPHVGARLRSNGIGLIHGSFTMPAEEKNSFCREVERLAKKAGFKTVESCGEFAGTRVGCVSAEDLRVLGLDPSELNPETSPQRKSCLCSLSKTELLNQCKRCPHGCLYCYWKD